LQALAAAERGHQAQHRRGGNTCNRGAESQAEALYRHRQRRAHGFQVGGFFQREYGALERDDHAEEGAEHPQHDQQADQVGRQGRAGQAGALALDTQAYWVLQRNVQARQKAVQVRLLIRDGAQPRGEAGSRLAETVQLEGAGEIHREDQRRHRHRHGAGIDEAKADPDDRERAGEEGKTEQVFIHGVLFD
jgi:hypothetical protein